MGRKRPDKKLRIFIFFSSANMLQSSGVYDGITTKENNCLRAVKKIKRRTKHADAYRVYTLSDHEDGNRTQSKKK